MKSFSIALLATLVITGCGGGRGDVQSQNSAAKTQLSAQIANKNSLQIREAGIPGLSSTSETALGKDDDKNGVWDDVDQYIASGFKDPEKAKAMRQLAAAVQNALVNNDTPEKAQEATRVWFRALECVDQKLGEAGYYESKRLTAEMLNSELRSRAYALHDSNSGGFYSMPTGAVCDN